MICQACSSSCGPCPFATTSGEQRSEACRRRARNISSITSTKTPPSRAHHPLTNDIDWSRLHTITISKQYFIAPVSPSRSKPSAVCGLVCAEPDARRAPDPPATTYITDTKPPQQPAAARHLERRQPSQVAHINEGRQIFSAFRATGALPREAENKSEIGAEPWKKKKRATVFSEKATERSIAGEASSETLEAFLLQGGGDMNIGDENQGSRTIVGSSPVSALLFLNLIYLALVSCCCAAVAKANRSEDRRVRRTDSLVSLAHQQGQNPPTRTEDREARSA